MNALDFIHASLTDEEQYFSESIHEITDKELMWRPSNESNNINWIVWHMSRVEDMWFNFFCNKQLELWETHSWYTHFNLPTRDNGFGHTADQIKAFPKLDFADLLKYRNEVRNSTLNYLISLQESDLTIVPREQRPEMAISDVFVRILNELFQHIGHINYIRGLFNSK